MSDIVIPLLTDSQLLNEHWHVSARTHPKAKRILTWMSLLLYLENLTKNYSKGLTKHP